MTTDNKASIDEQLKMLPSKPGVYLMRNGAGQVIYVGKAVSLKNRVRSYFQHSRNHSAKTVSMVGQIATIDYILTDSEVEALILENNLIKEHNPKYNIRLRDDKTYPYIKVTEQEDFPRIYPTRRLSRDGARYFGPYTNVEAMHETVRLLKRIFPLRDCRKPLKPEAAVRPCLNYHIGKCAGPCSMKINADSYRKMVEKVEAFLEGKHEFILKDLRKDMEEAAESLDFEKAAELRDQITSVEKIIEHQKITSTKSDNDQDVMAIAVKDTLACVQVFLVRDGHMVGREHFYLDGVSDDSPGEILKAFVEQYYAESPFVPKEIIIPTDVEELEDIVGWLSEKRGSKVVFHVPKRGDKLRLVEMGMRNAEMLLSQAELKMNLEGTRIQEALEMLADYIKLPQPPNRIEAYDISNIQGTETVASMVVFEGGKPKKSDYRRFKIKTVEGPNDFASMAEVISRRFTKALDLGEDEEAAKFGALPDLVLIDGGKGQLSSARREMSALGFDWIPTVGLAKDFEYIFTPDSSDPVILPRDSQALYLVQRIRDEAHRFAITYHRSLRGRSQVKSVLDEIPGIGKKRRLALLREFGSVDGIRKAKLSQLAKVDGMTKDVAKRVYDLLHKA